MLDLGRFLATLMFLAMPESPIPFLLSVHPHQLEVQEFSSYALIVDLRSSAEFQDDHLPGAVSVPWSASAALGGAVHEAGFSEPEPVLLGSSDTSAALYAIEARLAGLAGLAGEPPGASLLVYCGRGGIDSVQIAAQLGRRGHDVDVLPGGWHSYRGWVTAAMSTVANRPSFCWVRSVPGGASQAVLAVVESQGHQVMSLAALLARRKGFRTGLPGLCVPGPKSLSQDAFETLLVDALRCMDPSRPVWVDEVLFLGDKVALPSSLQQALCRASVLRVEVPMAARLAWLSSWWEAQGTEPQVCAGSLMSSMLRSKQGIPWPAAAGSAEPVAGESDMSPERLLAGYLDPLYSELAPVKTFGSVTQMALSSLAPETIQAGLAALPDPWPQTLQPGPDQTRP